MAKKTLQQLAHASCLEDKIFQQDFLSQSSLDIMKDFFHSFIFFWSFLNWRLYIILNHEINENFLQVRICDSLQILSLPESLGS